MSGPPDPLSTLRADRVVSVNACSGLNKRKIRLSRDSTMPIFLDDEKTRNFNSYKCISNYKIYQEHIFYRNKKEHIFYKNCVSKNDEISIKITHFFISIIKSLISLF